MYEADLQTAFEAAKAAGEIPANTFTVEIPDSPDSCNHFVDAVEDEIAKKEEDIIDL